MYKIGLKSLFNQEGFKLDINREADFSDINVSGENPFTGPVHIHGEIRNVAGVVFMDAKAECEITTSCDRCACELVKQLSFPIVHTFVTELNNEEDDYAYIVVPNMEFDLDALVKEDVLLAIPSKVLCKPDCKGLCSQCGKNLNDGPCDCKEPVDPRLAGLLSLLEDDDN